MPTVNSSLEIPASPEDVWGVATDLSRYGEWNTTHTAFPDGAPEDLSEGASFREQITLMGMPGEATWTVAEVNGPNRVVWDGAGPMGIKLGTRLELAESGAGTTVTLEASFEGGPLVGPLGDSLGTAAEKSAAESLANLKGLLDGAG